MYILMCPGLHDGPPVPPNTHQARGYRVGQPEDNQYSPRAAKRRNMGKEEKKKESKKKKKAGM